MSFGGVEWFGEGVRGFVSGFREGVGWRCGREYW